MTVLDADSPATLRSTLVNPNARSKAMIGVLTKLRQTGYRFTTVTPVTHALVNERPENQTARDLRGIFGWNRPFSESAVDAEWLALMRRADIVEPWRGLWRSRIRVSTLDDRIYMHSAYPTTRPDAVFFGPDTYRFVSAIHRHLLSHKLPIRRVVDIGCGAGPGAITVAAALPDAEVYAVDINQTALHMTDINAVANAVFNVTPRFSDLLSNVSGLFDLIVANPPYLIDPSARTYRHGGGDLGEGLSLDMVAAALPHLAAGGSLLLYTGVAIVDGVDVFWDAVQSQFIAHEFDWSYNELDPDIFAEELNHHRYGKADRIAAVLLKVTRRNENKP